MVQMIIFINIIRISTKTPLGTGEVKVCMISNLPLNKCNSYIKSKFNH